MCNLTLFTFFTLLKPLIPSFHSAKDFLVSVKNIEEVISFIVSFVYLPTFPYIRLLKCPEANL